MEMKLGDLGGVWRGSGGIKASLEERIFSSIPEIHSELYLFKRS